MHMELGVLYKYKLGHFKTMGYCHLPNICVIVSKGYIKCFGIHINFTAYLRKVTFGLQLEYVFVLSVDS